MFLHLLPGATVMPVDQLSQCRCRSPSAVPLRCYGLHNKCNLVASDRLDTPGLPCLNAMFL